MAPINHLRQGGVVGSTAPPAGAPVAQGGVVGGMAPPEGAPVAQGGMAPPAGAPVVQEGNYVDHLCHRTVMKVLSQSRLTIGYGQPTLAEDFHNCSVPEQMVISWIQDGCQWSSLGELA